jgi:uncharacterized protein YciI
VYFLVVITDAGRPDSSMPDHEPFVDLLIERRQVLLGGRLVTQSPGSPAIAAYVLRCESLAEAERLAAADPLVEIGGASSTVTQWDLVALDLRAVESGTAVLD